MGHSLWCNSAYELCASGHNTQDVSRCHLCHGLCLLASYWRTEVSHIEEEKIQTYLDYVVKHARQDKPIMALAFLVAAFEELLKITKQHEDLLQLLKHK
jgi:hypothetical protein